MIKVLYKYIAEAYKAAKAAEFTAFVLKALKDLFFIRRKPQSGPSGVFFST